MNDAAPHVDEARTPGVTATSPATMPDARPRAVGLPLWIHSTSIQLSPAAAAAACVAANAGAAEVAAAPSADRR